jgi:hypothetical protein
LFESILGNQPGADEGYDWGVDFSDNEAYDIIRNIMRKTHNIYRRDTGKIPPFKVGYESVSNLNFSN